MGTPCGEDIQCVTQYCNASGECGYRPMDAGPDSAVDAADLGCKDAGADAPGPDAGGDAQGQDADVDASTDA